MGYGEGKGKGSGLDLEAGQLREGRGVGRRQADEAQGRAQQLLGRDGVRVTVRVRVEDGVRVGVRVRVARSSTCLARSALG